MTGRLDTIVVGAGHAGLTMSSGLAAAGRDHVVLERGRVGETWRSQRWDGFRLNTPGWMNVLPGVPATADPDGFASGAELVADLEVCARALPVRTGMKVTSVRPGPFGFTVVAGDEELQADNVVLASGAMNVSALPAIAAGVSSRVHQVHAGAYKSAAALPEGAVLVVGGAQSGVQVAEDLVRAGRRTYLSTSLVGRYPRRYRGRDTLDWLWDGGYFDERLEVVGQAALRVRQPHISGTDGGHSVSYQSLARQGVTLLGRAVAAAGERLHLARDLGENARFADTESARYRRGIDDYIGRERLEACGPEPDPGDADDPELWKEPGPETLDLRAAGIGSIVWCTGFGGCFDWLPAELLDDAGRPRHRGGVTDYPGLYVLGLPWLRRRASSIVAGAAADAAFLLEEMTDSTGWRARGAG